MVTIKLGGYGGREFNMRKKTLHYTSSERGLNIRSLLFEGGKSFEEGGGGQRESDFNLESRPNYPLIEPIKLRKAISQKAGIEQKAASPWLCNMTAGKVMGKTKLGRG